MLEGLKKKVPQEWKNYYHWGKAALAAYFYKKPASKLKIIGVTGTDGKSTTVNLIYHILKESGKKVSMISTVKAVIGEESFDTGLHVTTPDPIAMQRYLYKMVRDGSEYAVLEITSHALDQNRVSFIPFTAAVFTNVTHEHLDYHGSYENYLGAKAKLLKNVKYAVLNGDDESYGFLKKRSSGKIVSYGLKNSADFFARDVYLGSKGIKFLVEFKEEGQIKHLRADSPLIGEFNVYNNLAAVVLAKQIGIENRDIEKAVGSFQGLLGRMERIDFKDIKFDVIVDFAHTPKSLEAALKTLRKLTKGRLIVVFGSAGERDIGKRALMGEVAGKLADLAVVTAEDPRSEKVEDISDEVARGLRLAGRKIERDYFKIPDRRQAIEFATIKLARADDLVAAFGKGHERSMNIGGKELPWNEQEIVRKALEKRARVDKSKDK